MIKSYFQIFIRTGLKAYLLEGIGIIITIMTILIFFFLEDKHIEWGLFLGLILVEVGMLIGGSKESGGITKLYERTTFFQRITGNVPIISCLKIEPTLKKQWGFVVSSLVILRIIPIIVFYEEILQHIYDRYIIISFIIYTLLLWIIMLKFTMVYGK